MADRRWVGPVGVAGGRRCGGPVKGRPGRRGGGSAVWPTG